jgi:DNA-binding transcriptional ArsR family regulator
MLGQRPKAETDRVFTALSHANRRRLLFELLEAVEDDPIEYTDFALPKNTLHHVHLPKLEEFGYVEANRSEGTIRRGPQWDEIEPLLELVSTYLYEPQSLRGKRVET